VVGHLPSIHEAFNSNYQEKNPAGWDMHHYDHLQKTISHRKVLYLLGFLLRELKKLVIPALIRNWKHTCSDRLLRITE
jgi:uncharacterized protein YijF (DUF1287 family)